MQKSCSIVPSDIHADQCTKLLVKYQPVIPLVRGVYITLAVIKACPFNQDNVCDLQQVHNRDVTHPRCIWIVTHMTISCPGRWLFEEDHPLDIALDASCSHLNSKLVLRTTRTPPCSGMMLERWAVGWDHRLLPGVLEVLSLSLSLSLCPPHSQTYFSASFSFSFFVQ